MMTTEQGQKLMLAQQLPKEAIALVLAGGRGTRLKALTSKRAKPAVFFGGGHLRKRKIKHAKA